MFIPPVSQSQSDSPALRAWIHSPSAPHIHRLAYCGGDQPLREQISLLHGAELYRDFVNKVTGRIVADPVLPLVIEVDEALATRFQKGHGRKSRLSHIVPLTWEALTAPAGPYQLSPMQLAIIRGHTRVIELLQGANKLRAPGPLCSTSNDAAAAWAKQMVVRRGTSTHLSQFSSSLDIFLRKHLGDDLYEGNVAKVILDNRRYVFIADRHQNLVFKSLVRPLIVEIERTHATKPVAFFMEGNLRDPEMESHSYQGYFRGVKPQGLFYGPESPCFNIVYWLTQRDQILKGRNTDAMNFLWNATYNPATRQALTELQRRKNSPALDAMATAMGVCTQIAQRNYTAARDSLVAQPFFKDQTLWADFYVHLAQIGMDLGWMPAAGVKATLNVIKKPDDEDIVDEFRRVVNFEVRDPILAHNILSVVRPLPQHIEVVIFMGFLHMPGLVHYLQDPAT